jgi:hypothetical protein
MFEMKNESDATATKNRNEDFLKELDRDRTEKKCEYAVLVSLLEPESELYNSGIVDVFHRYPKMYVIRPQFFIPMITLLRNAAMNALQVQVRARPGEGAERRRHALRGRAGILQGRIRQELRPGLAALPDRDRRDRQVDRSPAEDQGGAARYRPQPATGQRQGPGRDDQETHARATRPWPPSSPSSGTRSRPTASEAPQRACARNQSHNSSTSGRGR